MNNFQKMKKEMRLEDLRMLLADVKLPIRCVFCIYKNNNVMGCGDNSARHCSEGIDKFLRKEVEK
jgi:hypothetical protein